MVRLVGDALAIAGVIKDDSQIVRILAIKTWEPHSGNGHTLLTLAEAPPYEIGQSLTHGIEIVADPQT
jgi:hypothetical protein